MTNFLHEIETTLSKKPYFEAAGVLLYSLSTKRYLFVERGDHVKQPRTWAGIGGEIDPGETAEEAAEREVFEEAGYDGPITLKKVHIFRNGNFKYTNFLGAIPAEFEPDLNWENRDYVWCGADELPEPLHPGIVEMLKSVKL